MRAEILGISTILILSSCAPSSSLKTVFPDASQKAGACLTNAIPKEFVIHWKSGHVTKTTGASREELITNVIHPRLDEIQFVEPNYRLQVDSDVVRGVAPRPAAIAPELKQLNWNIQATSAAAAWAAGATGKGIVVAVIDSGVDITHPQLQGQIYVNAAEAGGQPGVDDDGNGYVDDVNGWNFTNNSPVQNDVVGHGTHVSGTIGAAHTGPLEPLGFAPEVKIMPLQFIADDSRGGSTFDAIRAIQYGVAMGAQVLNASWGNSYCSQTLRGVVAALDQKNVLFVTAAGNSSHDLSLIPEFPAAFQGTHQITVAATAEEFLRAGFSNFGALVQVGAPGMDIISTFPHNAYAAMDGTSMASPAVAGEAAAIWSARPHATASQIRAAILAGVDRGIASILTGGQINVEKALAALRSLPE